MTEVVLDLSAEVSVVHYDTRVSLVSRGRRKQIREGLCVMISALKR